MVKLKLISGNYSNGSLHLEAGDVFEVAHEEAARLQSDYPGKFEVEGQDSTKPDHAKAKKARG